MTYNQFQLKNKVREHLRLRDGRLVFRDGSTFFHVEERGRKTRRYTNWMGTPPDLRGARRIK